MKIRIDNKGKKRLEQAIPGNLKQCQPRTVRPKDIKKKSKGCDGVDCSDRTTGRLGTASLHCLRTFNCKFYGVNYM